MYLLDGNGYDTLAAALDAYFAGPATHPDGANRAIYDPFTNRFIYGDLARKLDAEGRG